MAIPSIAATGCAVLGPTAITNGRAAYNDALVSTNNQQVLAMIVQMRYGEPSGLLAVSSVTANLHIQTSIGSEFGIGPDSNFEGNLTPLSAGIAYEENPTISYTPPLDRDRPGSNSLAQRSTKRLTYVRSVDYRTCHW